ncbi:hypothetical protein [Labrys monachus]|uniref:Transmembrane protein n=1 Tax=Labrys monachus TaxID=217067 RepID=A0ABU0F9B2_9HYPH|nr:hypothetical protein [Labrys monachus]MDQ0390645.1 hypothetical protein [Labrys monachus]
MKSNALLRLLQGVRKPSPDKRPSIETFPDLDVDRIARDLGLEKQGRERGRNEEPPTASPSMDRVEARIVERIEAEKKAAHTTVENELRTYVERLSALDFEGRFSEIRQTAPACVGEFKAEISSGLDELYGLRRGVRDLDEEQQNFRRKHRIDRTARLQQGASTFLKVALLIVLFIVEAIVNGNFLAKGSEQGLLGGVTEAISFASLNIVGTLIIAMYGVRQLNHRNIFRKFIGLAAFAFYLVFAFTLNITLAHYRDVSATFVEGGGERVLHILATEPLHLNDLNSWVFFAIGILFSIIAFIDGLSLSDPYPGYAQLQKRLEDARLDYSERRAELVDALRDVRDEYQEKMDEISRDLSARRSEYDAILAGRARMVNLFMQHQNHLERAGSVLLGIYRDANVKARTSEPPARFALPFTLERIVVEAGGAGEWKADELRARVGAIQDMLTTEVQEIHKVFEAAIDRYAQLENVVPEPGAADGSKAA